MHDPEDTIVVMPFKPPPGKPTTKSAKPLVPTAASQRILRTTRSNDKQSCGNANVAEIIDNDDDEDAPTFHAFAAMSVPIPESSPPIPETFQQAMASPDRDK